jgi:hypothetical protein
MSTSSGVNYPDFKTIRMDTYIGQTNHGDAAEAINILPAIVGASLAGVNKTTYLFQIVGGQVPVYFHGTFLC